MCVHEDARFLDAVEETGYLGLSRSPWTDARSPPGWPPRGRPARGQLDRVPHTLGPVTGVPLVDGALSTFECRTTATHPGGDHAIVVGEVVGMRALHPGPGDEPLVRFRGAYRTTS